MIVHRSLGESYVSEPLQHEPFDVIMIDGRQRVKCAEIAASALTARGVIVWDNAERSRYGPGRRMLTDHGFRHVAFYGTGPGELREWTTSIYYRDGNCLGL